MKKRLKLCLPMLLVALLLSACGGVSQAEYDKVVAERDALQVIVDAQKDIPFFNDDKAEGTTSTPTQTPSPTPEVQNTVAPGPQRVGLNETVSSDRLNITFLSCISMNKIGDYSARSGLKYGVMTFSFENISEEEMYIDPLIDFDYYADNVLCDSEDLWTSSRIGGYGPIESYNLLKPGRAMEGYVVCSIPTNAKHLEIEFEGFIFEYDFEE